MNDSNSIIQKNKEDDTGDFYDAKTFFTSRTQRNVTSNPNESEKTGHFNTNQKQQLEENFQEQGEQEINIEGSTMQITARKGKFGKEQVVNSFRQLDVVQEEVDPSTQEVLKIIPDQNDPKDKSEKKNKKDKEEEGTFIDAKLRDLKRVWREKERYIKCHNSSFKHGTQDKDFKFTGSVADPTFKSYADNLDSGRFIEVWKQPASCPSLVKDMLNIVNIKISPKNLSKVSLSTDHSSVIVRTEDNSCFYLFSIKSIVMKELVNQVFETELDPPKEAETKKEAYFMSKLNSIVNRQTIMNNSFVDVKFVPTDEDYLYSAGKEFLTLWFQNSKGTLEIENNLIQNINDPEIKLIAPIDTHSIFVVGEDFCLQGKTFDFVLNKMNEKKDFTLRKEPISLLKLYKCESDVTDVMVVPELNIVILTDIKGNLQKIQYTLKSGNQVCKLQSKFSIRDNKGEGMQGLFDGAYGIKLYHVQDVGQMVHRNDNRVLLYDQENEDQMVKLKDFQMFNMAQLSFDAHYSYIYIPCNENFTSKVKVFDYLEAPKGVINSGLAGHKVKNNQQNQFSLQGNDQISYQLTGSPEICDQLAIRRNSIFFSFSQNGVFSVYLGV